MEAISGRDRSIAAFCSFPPLVRAGFLDCFGLLVSTVTSLSTLEEEGIYWMIFFGASRMRIFSK
jgi:hypothetical protein